MVKKDDVKKLLQLREEKSRIEKEEKALTKKLISDAGSITEKEWQGLSYEIVERTTTTANREKIKTLPEWEQYFNTSTHKQFLIHPCYAISKNK